MTNRKPRHAAQTVDMLSPHGARIEGVPRRVARGVVRERHGWQIIPGTVRTIEES